jgi:hypothetical protein
VSSEPPIMARTRPAPHGRSAAPRKWAVGRELDLIVVNGLYPDRFNDEETEWLHAFAGRVPAVARRSPTTGTRGRRRAMSGHCERRRARR